MKCCVITCNNDTKTTPKHQGTTFHLFPTNTETRERWLTSLGLQADVNEHSLICSEHFYEQDFFYTKSGLKCIRNDSTPFVQSCEDLETPAAYSVCRICLSVDTKMYDLKEFNLHHIYQQLTGLLVDLGLPQVVCSECGQRLRSANTLRYKAFKSHTLLMNIYNGNPCLTIKDIKTINRQTNKLKSNLIQTLYESSDYDYQIKDNQLIKNEPPMDFIENNHNGIIDNHNQIIDNHNQIIDNHNGMIDNHDEKIELLTEVEIKDEASNEIFFDEYDGFESDDDKKLSEIYPTSKSKKTKVKKKKEKVEKRVKESKKKDEENNPSSTMDKYKKSDVKRRKNDAPDETLFTISNLTYEEQIQEIEQRQESNSFKNSPYKCTVCYRGFLLKDRYDAHIIRHSEKCGAFECFICKSRLKTGRALRKHLTAQHTEKFTCKGCPFVTRNRGVAREHERWHSGTKYQCPHCPTEFDKLTTYLGHIRIKHVSDFICSHCGYSFVSQKGIDVHKKRKHRLDNEAIPEDGPYCEVCNVKFVSEEAHARHLKLSSRHLSDDDPNRIRNDSQSMHTEKNGRVMRRIERRPSIHPRVESQPSKGPITCEQCGIQLRDLRLYAQHFRRAHPDKNRTKYPPMKTPCMCDQCGRIFQSMALLKDHMWVHTGEKRFKCSRCPKSFTQKTNLVFHERVHSATRPTYECPLCGKHFAFFNNRRRHMFIHTGLKPYKCETCGKCFTTAGEQRAHVEHVHMKKPWPKRARRKDETWQDKCSED